MLNFFIIRSNILNIYICFDIICKVDIGNYGKNAYSAVFVEYAFCI